MTIATTVPGHESHRESTREYRGRQAPTRVTASSQPLAIVRLIGRVERDSGASANGFVYPMAGATLGAHLGDLGAAGLTGRVRKARAGALP